MSRVMTYQKWENRKLKEARWIQEVETQGSVAKLLDSGEWDESLSAAYQGQVLSLERLAL